jgi:hypothetical protein
MTMKALLAVAAALSLLGCEVRPGVSAKQDRAGTTIPGLEAGPASSAPIRVEEVKIVQETAYSLIVEVTYVYQGTPPAAEVELLVLADMPYWASTPVKVAAGRHVARASVGLYEKKLKEDGRSSYETSVLTVSFRHYAPDGFKGALFDETVPFKKAWQPRS